MHVSREKLLTPSVPLDGGGRVTQRNEIVMNGAPRGPSHSIYSTSYPWPIVVRSAERSRLWVEM